MRPSIPTYDGLGRIVGTIDGLGHERRSAYDVLGRVVQEIVNYDDGVVDGSDGTDRDLITTRVYDRSGRLELSVAPGERHTEYSYTEFDTVGLVIENVGGGGVGEAGAALVGEIGADVGFDGLHFWLGGGGWPAVGIVALGAAGTAAAAPFKREVAIEIRAACG